MIGGWQYSERDDAPRAGASQAALHAQLRRSFFPVENAPTQLQARIGSVDVSLVDDEFGSALVFESGYEHLESLASLVSRELQNITQRGESFNIIAVSTETTIKVFLADRIKSVGEGFSYRELGFGMLGRSEITYLPEEFSAGDLIARLSKAAKSIMASAQALKVDINSLKKDAAMVDPQRPAQNVTSDDALGGIDFSDELPLEAKGEGQAGKFEIDPGLMAQLKNASGLVPVVVGLEPLSNLEAFLGLNVSF